MKRREVIRALLSATAGATTIVASSVALARIGRPLSPGSIAGVRRRTRRRTRRRIRRRMVLGMSLTALPYGCYDTRVLSGVTYSWCNGIWYQPVYHGTTVVYVVHKIDDGAETTVEIDA